MSKVLVFGVGFGFGRRFILSLEATERPLDLDRLKLPSLSIFSSSVGTSISAAAAAWAAAWVAFLPKIFFFVGPELVSLSVFSTRALFCPIIAGFWVFVVLAMLLVGADEGPGDIFAGGIGSL